MFNKVYYPKITFKEFLHEGHWVIKPLVLLIATFLKVFRFNIPYSMCIPPVESLANFRTTPDKISNDLLAPITETDQQLHDLGFSRTDLLGIRDMTQNTRYAMAVYRSTSGDTVAWVRFSSSPQLERKLRYTRVAFISLGPNGQVVQTTSASRDISDPPEWHVQYHVKMDAEQLLERHHAHVVDVLGNARPMIAADDQAAMDLLEHAHHEFVQYQKDRGVYVETGIDAPAGQLQPPVPAASPTADTAPAVTANPFVIPGATESSLESSVAPTPNDFAGSTDDDLELIDPDEVVPVAEIVAENQVVNPFAAAPVTPVAANTMPEQTTAAPFDGPTLGEQERAELQPIIDAVRARENKQSGWIKKLALLGISIAFFVGLGAWQWDLKLVLMLVPILFIHELGHYVAMRIFGYRNVQMFFIPLFGAAVSGRHYRVDGWKKSMVSLAGPLPSIFLGIGLGIAGGWHQNELLTHAALLTIFINLVNLLPFLPLDGGWIAHITLFSRSNVLDLIVRVGAAGLLAIAGGLLGDKILLFLGIFMFIGLPTVWKTMNATELVRRQSLPEPTKDEMPEAAIAAVVDAIQSSGIQTLGPKPLANMTLQVYENAVVQPPSWPATLGVWALYFGGIVTGLAGMGLVLVSSWGGLMGLDDYPEYEPQYQDVTMEEGDFRLGSGAPVDDETVGDAEEEESEYASSTQDMLAWRFPDDESAEQAFNDLKEADDQTVARLDNLVFATREVDHPHQTELQDIADMHERAAITEKAASMDLRLDIVSGETWRRAFFSRGPQLNLVVDQELADKLVEQAENLPYTIGRNLPIAPWTPRLKLTPQQIELQKTLRLLQGSGDEIPWTVEELDEDISVLDFSSKKMKDYMNRMSELAERNAKYRTDWIEQQAKTADGDRKKLLDSYVTFEKEMKAWRDDERSFTEKGPAPQLSEGLEPLLPTLGYLHDGHPLKATSAGVELYVLEDDEADWEFGDDFPLPIEGKTVVQVYVSPTHDSAAAYACVHAWLKKEGVQQIVWQYDTPIPKE